MIFKRKGSFATPMTPFNPDKTIDYDSLQKEVDFIIKSNAAAIVSPVMVSEFQILSEDERINHVKVTLDVAKGRVPVVASVSALNTHQALKYLNAAQKFGADCVISMPPYVTGYAWPDIKLYFKTLSDNSDIPIMIQNHNMAGGLSAGQVAELCQTIEKVDYIKEEVAPETLSIENLTALNIPELKAVVGGSGGKYIIQEHDMGAVGIVHACQYCDLLQKVWDLLEAGERKKARELNFILSYGIVLESQYGMAYSKHIMIKRNIFKEGQDFTRGSMAPISAYRRKEIDEYYAIAEPYLIEYK
jgi:4-hydroxy-tetrahydrodipicolinate synthase